MKIKLLSKSFGKDLVIDDLTLSFIKGKINIIMAPSGSGKTTLLNILSSLLKYDKGEIIGFDKEKIAYIFQEARLFPFMSVYENIFLVLKNKIPKEEIEKAIIDSLKKVSLLEYKDSYPNELSGGMSQRVSLARAIATKPELLFADEPFSALDISLKKEMGFLLKEVCAKNNTTFISATHDIQTALQIADKLFVFSKKPLKEYKEYILEDKTNKEKEIISKEIEDFLMRG